MSHHILLRRAAERGLADLPRQVQIRVIAALELLRDTPRSPGTTELAGDLRGLRKLRVGRYRVAYEVDDAESCVRVWAIGHRHTFYDRLRRRT